MIMGALQAFEMAKAAREGDTALRAAVEWQLTANHYPPVPVSMVDPCLQAITSCNYGQEDELIDLPAPATWRGQNQAPAWAVVQGHHLEAFLNEREW